MEQDEAYHTKTANKILLRNILPEHVGSSFFILTFSISGREHFDFWGSVEELF